VTATESSEQEVRAEDVGHPRGTLAILIVYGVLFGLGWMAMFFFEFMPRGAPHP